MANGSNGSNQSNAKNLLCSFCGKGHSRNSLIVSGQSSATMCYDCVKVLGQLIQSKNYPNHPVTTPDQDLVPKSIYKTLDQYVIGQNKAKKVLSVAVYNHFKRVWNSSTISDVELQKTNILLIGPTGCGKTLLAETLAKTLSVPFAICDATSLTESGYVGEDVENILLRLIQSADWDISRAEHGIIYIDELDKIARKEGINRSITRDVSGEGVQQELLKIIEGCIANVPPQGGRKHPHQDFLQINTNDILFICGGAFEGLDDIVAKRATTIDQMGFLSNTQKKEDNRGITSTQITPEDLLEFGFIPEIVGRLPVVTQLESLDKESLIQVLKEPKNAIIKQYQQLFHIDNIELEFTDDALEAAAEMALTHNTGARSLRYIIENTLLDVMYELPSMKYITKCVVDRDCINGTGTPTLTDNSDVEFKLPSSAIQQSA
ncbi:MAG: ATP-dependent Clp protease ATP-binding subunit ClpX [Dehalococcoidia bacterium]|nr:ATP-dependent Clp protease ATP-binding subunit ClpX [Dehalococcoidia bacterium]